MSRMQYRTQWLHAVEFYWTTRHAEPNGQQSIPGLPPPPTDPGALTFALILYRYSHDDGSVRLSFTRVGDVYGWSSSTLRRWLRLYKRLTLVADTNKAHRGAAQDRQLMIPAALADAAKGGSPVTPQTVTKGGHGRPPKDAQKPRKGGHRRPERGATSDPPRSYKPSSAQRGSAGAAQKRASGPADDDAADADGAAPPPASKSNGSRPKSKTNDAPTPTPPDAADVLASDDRNPDDGFTYGGRPTTIRNPRRDVRARPPGWEQQQRQFDDDARAEAMAALARLADPNPEGDSE